MILKVTAAYKDGGDGGFSIRFFNTRQEGLDNLGRTEEELAKGNEYDDGALVDLNFDIDNNANLTKPIYLHIGQ